MKKENLIQEILDNKAIDVKMIDWSFYGDWVEFVNGKSRVYQTFYKYAEGSESGKLITSSYSAKDTSKPQEFIINRQYLIDTLNSIEDFDKDLSVFKKDSSGVYLPISE